MISILAHITPTDLPSGVLLFVAGVAVGLLAAALARQYFSLR